jgi:hypothetical protein
VTINWGSIADWVSGIGSLAAVITALHLARASNKIRLRVHIGHRLLLVPGQAGKRPEFVQIGVTSVGSRVARVTSVGYRVGVRKKQLAIQTTEQTPISDPMPKDLTDGQEAQWMIPLDRQDNWIDRFCKDFLLPNWRIRLWSTRLQVYTSVGQVFEARFEPSIKRRLAEACVRLKAAGSDKG